MDSFCGSIQNITVELSSPSQNQNKKHFPSEALIRICDQQGKCLPKQEGAWNLSYEGQFWSRSLSGLPGFMHMQSLAAGELTLEALACRVRENEKELSSGVIMMLYLAKK